MCSSPKIFDGVEVSCRECDHCAATYKNTWVARCMAELQTNPHALAFTLTYADVDGVPPLGALVYRYRDVQLFWKRLRKAGVKKYGADFELRYIVVGEKGSRFGRCHYHGVMFSNHPIKDLGKFSGARSKGFSLNRRLDWSLWGHGFVECQPATRKGMSYALKYILKSRMTAARSKGMGREGKTEYLASSYMWCSKRPAIGAPWLWKKLHYLADSGMVPASLRFRVSGGGDWYVSGELQREVCLWLHELHKKSERPLAGWSALLASVSEPIENTETGELVPRKPWEWLTNGEPEEEKQPPSVRRKAYIRAIEQSASDKLSRESAYFGVQYARRVAAQCGGFLPCSACLAKYSEKERTNIQQAHKLEIELSGERPDRYEAKRRREGRASQYCFKRGDSFIRVNLENYAREKEITRRISKLQTTSR